MKKLLGLLAVAPMALAACGPVEDKGIDYDATAYGATHGGTQIIEGERTIGYESGTVADGDAKNHSIALADFNGTNATCGDVDFTTAENIAVVEAAVFNTNNGYDLTVGTAITTVDGSATDNCDIADLGTIIFDATENTMVKSGLSKASVKLDEDNKVTHISIDETLRHDVDGTKNYVVVETYVDTMDDYGYRLMSKTEADKFQEDFAFDVEWKHGSDYMDGTWTITLDALVENFIGLDLAEAQTKLAFFEANAGDENYDWIPSGITGASQKMKHIDHYAGVITEAIKMATEANAAE